MKLSDSNSIDEQVTSIWPGLLVLDSIDHHTSNLNSESWVRGHDLTVVVVQEKILEAVGGNTDVDRWDK